MNSDISENTRTDWLCRGIIDAFDIRFALADCPQTTQDIVRRHHCDPVSAHILARAVGCATLVSTLLTEDEKYTLRWNYQGKLATVLADCNAAAHVRAFITPTNLGELVQSEHDICGETGTVTVIKSTPFATLNSGSTDAHLLNVADDLAFYFSTSDQIETAFTVLVALRPDAEAPIRTCRGLMLQALPGCDLQRFDRIRNRLATPEARQLLGAAEVQDGLFEPLLQLLCQDENARPDITLQHTATPQFQCTCSRERMLAALGTMPAEERQQALERDGHITMTCRFCNTTQQFLKQDFPDN